MADPTNASIQRLRPAGQRLSDRADFARFLLGRHFLDEIHMLSDQHRLDPAMVLIAETVAIGTMERSVPRPGQCGDGQVARPRPMSRRAIALATGLPRETVRRRVGRLVELGLLQEGSGGIACSDRFLHDGQGQLLTDMLARHVCVTNQLIAEGLIEPEALAVRVEA
jgi:CRP-like cAMP-binding protein